MSSTSETPDVCTTPAFCTGNSPTCPPYVPDVSKYVKAAIFAAEKHKGQKRKSDDSPYINHPLGVAHILNDEGGVTEIEVLQAAVLHDTVEDTDCTLDEIEANFGARVRGIVGEVSDDKSLNKGARKRAQIEHAAGKSRGAKLVKLADKLHNFRDLQKRPPAGWSTERVQGYFVWGRAVLAEFGRGVNDQLEAALDEVYQSSFVSSDGESHPTIPRDVDLGEFLERYIESMTVAADQ